jgi:flagellar export protein FliJ
MKRYSFRLAQVLRVRTIELDRAVGEIARARIELAAAVERTAAREQSYRELSHRPLGTTADELRTRREHQRLATEAVFKARGAERLQEQVVEARLADWADADRKVRLLEQLDERHRDRHASEVLAEEQLELDDLVTSRHGRVS